MKPISEIVFGFSDAENYRRRENKNLFNKIFLRTDALEKILKPNTFFLVGEKGTGKTAYAVYLSNSPHKNYKSSHKFIRETDYHKFIALRKDNALNLSDYTDIWKVIIYLLMADSVCDSANKIDFLLKYPKFKAIQSAIEEYYDSAFSSEIPVALQFVENSALAAKIVNKYKILEAENTATDSTQFTKNESKFQTNLLYIEKQFQEALSSLNLSDNHTLFIDGIDIRPASVPYSEYLDCVKGLANAVWSINNDFFPSIKASKGRMKIVLLLRPDIFNSLGLQNRNTKLRDNSAILNWNTVYSTHRNSELFQMADRMFSAQQDVDSEIGKAWDHYFPFNATGVSSEQSTYSSFITFLRYSFHRPRDILTALDVLRETYGRSSNPNSVFEYQDLFTTAFKRQYGEYLLGEIKDSLSFYYDESEFELFLKFFEFLHGSSKFSYEHYDLAFLEFSRFLDLQGVQKPSFMRSPEEFLQFLYDQNILAFLEQAEDEQFIRWCFKERSTANISPKVKIGMNYEIHYGLANILNTGKKFKKKGKSERDNFHFKNGEIQDRKKQKKAENDLSYGIILRYVSEKGFGFIHQEGLPIDIFFRKEPTVKDLDVAEGRIVSYRLSKDAQGRLVARNVRPAVGNAANDESERPRRIITLAREVKPLAQTEGSVDSDDKPRRRRRRRRRHQKAGPQ